MYVLPVDSRDILIVRLAGIEQNLTCIIHQHMKKTKMQLEKIIGYEWSDDAILHLKKKSRLI